MTSRERLIAAASGVAVDRKPVIAWPFHDDDADAMVLHVRSDSQVVADAGEKLALIEVLNPFGLALQRDIDLNKQLKDAPAEGDRILGGLADEVRANIQAALDAGADGVLYRLHGARALHCTPMQYGGHYLERDRELLGAAAGIAFTMVYVVGEEDVYLDFVSDLPAKVLGWDCEDSGIPVAEVRKMSKVALASTDPESDILLRVSTDHISKVLESSAHTEGSYG